MLNAWKQTFSGVSPAPDPAPAGLGAASGNPQPMTGHTTSDVDGVGGVIRDPGPIAAEVGAAVSIDGSTNLDPAAGITAATASVRPIEVTAAGTAGIADDNALPTGRQPEPSPAVVGPAVRYTLQELAAVAPGRSVELRVPPFGAVQVIEGSTHRRGTPPAVIEMTAQTWLCLATGLLSWDQAEARELISASGQRADLSPWLPLSFHT